MNKMSERIIIETSEMDPNYNDHQQQHVLFQFEDSTRTNEFDLNLDRDDLSYICGADVLIGASETIETYISPVFQIGNTNKVIKTDSDNLQDVPNESVYSIDIISDTSHEILASPLDSSDTMLDGTINNNLVNILSEQSGNNFSSPKCDEKKRRTRKQHEILSIRPRAKRGRKPKSETKSAVELYKSDSLKKHVLNHAEENKLKKKRGRKPLPPLKCSICMTELKNAKALQKHMDIHSEVKKTSPRKGRKPFFGIHKKPACSICLVEFTNTASLKTHMLIHSGERPFQCDLCEKTFTRNTILTIHRRLHTGEKPYKCKICSNDFVTKEALARHVSKDHPVASDVDSPKEKPSFKCQVCERKLCSKYSLQSHMNIHRLQSDGTKKAGVECRTCKKNFTCRYTLQRHVFEKHNLRGIITCNVCEMSFASKWEHSKHQDLHAASRKFQCDLCSMTFGKKFELLYHLQVHEAKKNACFSCYLCKKSYTSRESFVDHIQCYVQSELQIYSCPQCNISFSDPRQLKLHLNETHKLPIISDLNYCDICKINYPDGNAYYEHLFGKHDDVYILCNECNCYFKSRRQYDEHFMTHFS